MSRDIYLVAHAQSRHQVEKRIGGWYDTELTALGRRQALAIADRLAERIGDIRPVEVYASDLMRAAETAEPIAGRLCAPIFKTPDLRERSLGIAGGQPEAWLELLPPPRRDADRMDDREGIEGAETRREFAARLYRAMGRIMSSNCDVQIVVTHGGAVTFVVAAWIGMPLEAVGWAKFSSNAGGITHLREDDHLFDRAVISLNDRTHLASVL